MTGLNDQRDMLFASEVSAILDGLTSRSSTYIMEYISSEKV